MFCIDSYNYSTQSVKIHKTVEIADEEGGPTCVADMSSRGPNCDNFLANILKVSLRKSHVKLITRKHLSLFGLARFDSHMEFCLQPDIAAPGLDIVAGWPANVKLLTLAANDYRHLRFNILSGSSMACPHATGLALYIKSFNASWSPSAIKSALMTTCKSQHRSDRSISLSINRW